MRREQKPEPFASRARCARELHSLVMHESPCSRTHCVTKSVNNDANASRQRHEQYPRDFGIRACKLTLVKVAEYEHESCKTEKHGNAQQPRRRTRRLRRLRAQVMDSKGGSYQLRYQGTKKHCLLDSVHQALNA
jgi:hypothetical protein